MSHYHNLGGGRRDANEPEIMKRFLHHGWHPEQVSGNRLWDLNVYPPQRSGTLHGLTIVAHVDVKMPDGKVTPAQEEKWNALREKGIPVYVVRTAEDVDALVRGGLAAWEPDVAKLRKGLAVAEAIRTYPIPGDSPVDIRAPRGKGVRPPENGSDRLKPCGCKRSLGRCGCRGEDPPLPPVDIRTPLGTRAALAPGTGMSGGTKRGARPGQVTPRGKGTVIGKPPFQVRVASSGYTPPRSTPVDAAKEAEDTFAPPLVCNWGHSDCCLVHPGDRP